MSQDKYKNIDDIRFGAAVLDAFKYWQDPNRFPDQSLKDLATLIRIVIADQDLALRTSKNRAEKTIAPKRETDSTKIFTVYHKIKSTFREAEKLIDLKDYQITAEVKANNLEEVYVLTNHIDSDWIHNPEVVKVYNSHARSTSIGDLIFEPEEAARTKEVCHEVALTGWNYHVQWRG